MFGKTRARTPATLQLIPRTVHFDYETVMRENRYWHGGDPVTTHFFNALQAMFPDVGAVIDAAPKLRWAAFHSPGGDARS